MTAAWDVPRPGREGSAVSDQAPWGTSPVDATPELSGWGTPELDGEWGTPASELDDPAATAPVPEMPHVAPPPPEVSAPVADPDEGEAAFTEGFTPEALQAAQALLGRIVDDEATEVIMNGPAEVLIKVKGQRYHDPAVVFADTDTYHRIINEVLLAYVDTTGRIDGDTVLIEGQMEIPSGVDDVPPALARVHILAPPLVPHAKVTIAKKARWEYDLDGIAAVGSMTAEMADFLAAIAHARLTTLIAGVTGAGKTTLLQAMSHAFDMNDRIIVVEDTPELRLPIADVVYLNYSAVRGSEDTGVVSIEWLVRQAQRMRMDRVIVGEVRGAEAYEFLLAANSGAEGSATTIHADSPRRALDKMLALAAKGSNSTNEITLRREIAATIDVIVQTSLIDGRHVITAIEEVSRIVNQNAQIATQTLFEYDRKRGRWMVRNPLSDDLQNLLRQRGVTLNPGWFPQTTR